MWNRFVAIGDSITEGFGMEPVDGVEHLPWAERVARSLGAEFHNLGRRGLRAAQIRDTQLERALALEPDLVSIAAGCNDMLAVDFSREQVQSELEPMYAAFAATGATVFTFTYMNLPAAGLLPSEGARWTAERMEMLHEAVIELAGRYGALVIDAYNDPESADPGFFSSDLQHANAAGQAYVARKTLTALERHRALLAAG